MRDWLADLPDTPAACARKAMVLIASGIVLAAIGAWLPRDPGAAASDVPTTRVLFVAVLTTATSLGLHGLSYAIGGVRLLRRLRAARAAAQAIPSPVVVRRWPDPEPSTSGDRDVTLVQRI